MKKILVISLLSLILVACKGNNDVKDENEIAELSDEKAQQANEEMIKKNTDISAEAIAKQDPNLCNEIEDENMKGSCLYNILANQALQSKDPSFCDKIGLESFIENCKALLTGD